MSATQQYDVFISYARKDIKAADSLCRALDEAGVSYWIDREIHGSANFLTEITRYIKACNVVLFIASENSAKSEWTQKEILFALKHQKKIMPYRIGTFQFEENDELDLVFTNVQWKDSEAEVVASLRKLDQLSEKQEEQHHQRVPTGQTTHYKVGDYYDDGTKQGVVFEVEEAGRHGKIVSLRRSVETYMWCVAELSAHGWYGNRHNGADNQLAVQRCVGWQEKFPAFAWCAAQGRGWYLPSIEELRTLYRNQLVVETALQELDADELDLCWSSTGAGESKAYAISMYDGEVTANDKTDYDFVRPVATF